MSLFDKHAKVQKYGWEIYKNNLILHEDVYKALLRENPDTFHKDPREKDIQIGKYIETNRSIFYCEYISGSDIKKIEKMAEKIWKGLK